jgi:hypothetical protein
LYVKYFSSDAVLSKTDFGISVVARFRLGDARAVERRRLVYAK